MSSVIQSRILLLVRRRRARSSGEPPAPKQEVERHPRVADHRQRLCRRPPADRIGVHARIAIRTATGLIDVFDTELHRRDRRILAVPVGIQLVERGPHVHVRTLCLLRMRLREEYRTRAEVVTPDLVWLEGLRHPNIGVADDREVLAPRVEREQRTRREVEVVPYISGSPEVLTRTPIVTARAPMYQLDRDQARGIVLVDGRSPQPACRDHGIHQRKRDARTHSAQEGPPLHLLSRQKLHRVTLPRLRASGRLLCLLIVVRRDGHALHTERVTHHYADKER